MAPPSPEQVLVIPDEHFRAVGYFEGLRPFAADYLRRLLDPAQLRFLPRDEAELDPRFKQLIPYVLLEHDGRYFHYRRGSRGSERRLQSARSIGIGGHINPQDRQSGTDPYQAGMQRELHEEVAIDAGYTEECLAFIYDPRTPVGQVHLGVVHRLRLATARVEMREDGLIAGGFARREELEAERDQFETWSQLLFPLLRSA